MKTKILATAALSVFSTLLTATHAAADPLPPVLNLIPGVQQLSPPTVKQSQDGSVKQITDPPVRPYVFKSILPLIG